MRLYDFLAQFDLTVADNGNNAIIAALAYLEAHPQSGSQLKTARMSACRLLLLAQAAI